MAAATALKFMLSVWWSFQVRRSFQIIVSGEGIIRTQWLRLVMMCDMTMCLLFHCRRCTESDLGGAVITLANGEDEINAPLAA